MLSSVGITGVLVATVRVDREGEIRSIRVDARPGVHELFRTSLQRDLELLRFKPARTLGIARASTVEYTFRYVLVADATSPCPRAHDEREIIVCSIAPPVVRERTF
jgi:hypothetical protein